MMQTQPYHSMPYKLFTYTEPFTLECGQQLPGYHLSYTTYGALNKTRSNIVWIFHALTANSEAAVWWPGLIGQGKLFDPLKYYIICVNMPGSCYGSIGPLDKDPVTNTPYHKDFPFFTIKDMVRAYPPLKDFLGIEKIFIGIGASMGGQQLLEWAVEEPGLFTFIIPIATNAVHSAWGRAFNASQRFCIAGDVTWKTPDALAGTEGMKIARGVALLSYRHYDSYKLSQDDTDAALLQHYNSESYQRYQGEKLANRFNAISYYTLTQSMDSHNVGRNRGSIAQALQRITASAIVIGIRSDILFPTAEQQFLADHIPGATLSLIDSIYGHDGFLLEFGSIETLIASFIEQKNEVRKDYVIDSANG